VETRVERICGYEQAAKLEVLLRHVGETSWDDLEVAVGPVGQVRAGVTRHRKGPFLPSQQEQFEVVIDGNSFELSLAGTAGEDRVEDRRSFPVPPADAKRAEWEPFNFLEPRALSTDRITVEPEDGGPEVQAKRGVTPITAGKRYVVTIYPSHPGAEDVKLFRAAGEAEVEPRKSEGRAWSFLLTIVENPWLTHVVRLYYDVQVPGGRVLRGELYLSVRPSSGKLWAIAATAGAAMTIKGLTGLVPALLNTEKMQGDLLSEFSELLQKRWSDWFQLLSIPLFRGVLWLLDRLARPFREG
jgi:hypothetical protein